MAGLQVQLDPVSQEALAQLLADGHLETPLSASPFAAIEPKASVEGLGALSRLGLARPKSGGAIERPRLLEALNGIATSETVLHLELDGEAVSFAVTGESLVPHVALAGGFVVGEAVHVSQVVKRLRQLLDSEPGKLEFSAVSLRGTQAVTLVWGRLKRAIKHPVTAVEVETLLTGAGLAGDAETWFKLGTGWLERADGGFSIVPERHALATMLVKGRTVCLSRQEGFSLPLDVELLGRSGRWLFVSRANEGRVDETVGLVPATREAIAALVDHWVGLSPG